MTANNTAVHEVAVVGGGMLFAALFVDEPAVQWLMANLGRLALAGVLGSLIAGVLCLLAPDTTWRLTLGRVAAGGLVSIIAVSCAGAVSANGEGVASTMIWTLAAGIGGPAFLLSVWDFVKKLRESGKIGDALLAVGGTWASRFTGIVSPTGQLTMQNLPQALPNQQVTTIAPNVVIVTPKPTAPTVPNDGGNAQP